MSYCITMCLFYCISIVYLYTVILRLCSIVFYLYSCDTSMSLCLLSTFCDVSIVLLYCNYLWLPIHCNILYPYPVSLLELVRARFQCMILCCVFLSSHALLRYRFYTYMSSLAHSYPVKVHSIVIILPNYRGSVNDSCT